MAVNGAQSDDATCGALQVVFVEEDGTYRVDEEALRRVTSHEAARDLPVAVVSVAGATRGGKSFLLDFFLRYLRATDEARRDGSWIGAEDQPLTGFSWRGGCDRDTNGIVIWSEPIIVPIGTEEANEKVAVVLMDTQGTFDNSSTIRDSSIIFAMSSLLSSVQVYNLSQNIKEDDLQFLHLFTEFGKLAQEKSVESPFQVLQFLVRDWSYAYQHPIGAEGGKQLLDKKLEIRSEQAEELRELREHVRSVFEAVRCCLLPHPGLVVATDPHFRGCIKDIEPEFKNALLDFVPSLFSPGNITVKRMLGQEITLQELAQYFKSYIEVFNGDSLPSPVTITKALSMASLESALGAARAAYCREMARGGDTRHVSRGHVPRAHSAALQTARDTFTARKTLTAPDLSRAKLEALVRELDDMLPDYIAINGGKIAASITSSKAAYRKRMDEGMQKCLLPAELEELHAAARETARAMFDDSCSPTDWSNNEAENNEDDDAEDDDRNTLEQEVEALLAVYRDTNSEHIASLSRECAAALQAEVGAGARAARCRHPRALNDLYKRVRTRRLQAFDCGWTSPHAARNEHRVLLNSEFSKIYEVISEENTTNNNNIVAECVERYNARMDALFEGDKCMHPRNLRAEHEAAQDAARAHFLAQRPDTDLHFPVDMYQQNLQRDTIWHYLRFTRRNEDLNKRAVNICAEEYSRIMQPGNTGGFMETISFPNFAILERHGPAKNAAIEKFKLDFRREGPDHNEDEFLKSLEQEIETRYSWMILRLMGSLGFQAANIAFMTSFFLRK